MFWFGNKERFHVDTLFIERVEQLLQQRETLLPMLTALAAELPAARFRTELKRLITGLQNNATAEELCQSPAMVATLLPLLAANYESTDTAADSGLRLNQLVSESIRESELQRQRRRVLAYPLVMVLLTLAVMLLLCLAVVPVFDDIFSEFGLELPYATELLTGLSRYLRSRPLSLFLNLAAIFAAVYVSWRLLTASGLIRRMFGFLLRGNSQDLSAMATFSRRVAEGLAADLPLRVALQIAGETVDRPALRRLANELASDVASNHLKNSPATRGIPASMTHLLTVSGGEATTAARLLTEFSETLAERVQTRFDWTSGVVGQISVVMVGLLVGFVVLSLFSPLVTLVEGLS